MSSNEPSRGAGASATMEPVAIATVSSARSPLRADGGWLWASS